MSIKILIFDYKNSEKTFFSKNKFENYDLNFFEESLNEISVNNKCTRIKINIYGSFILHNFR